MSWGALLKWAVVAAALAWAAWWVAGAWAVSGLSWHFFADGSHELFHTDGLSLYAQHPELQVGPLSLVVAGAFEALPGGASENVALAAMALTGPALLGLLAVVVPADRRLPRMLLAALVLLPAWAVLAVRWGHLDDVLATALGVGAVVAVCRRRPVLAGDVPLSGGVSRHRAGQCSDHAVMSSGLATSSVFFLVTRAMEASER